MAASNIFFCFPVHLTSVVLISIRDLIAFKLISSNILLVYKAKVSRVSSFSPAFHTFMLSFFTSVFSLIWSII